MSFYPCTAEGCHKAAKSKLGLSIHRKTCEFRVPSMAAAFTKREAEEEAEAEAHKRRRVQEEEDENIGPFVEPQRDPTPPSPSPIPAPVLPRARSGRTLRVPKRLEDMVPSTKDDMPGHLADAFPEPDVQFTAARYVSPTVEDAPDADDIPKLWRTSANEFGISREYSEPLTRDPEDSKTLDSVCASPTLAREAPENRGPPKTIFWLTRNSAVAVKEVQDNPESDQTATALGPFPNKSLYRLYDWWYNSSITKSLDDFDELLDVLKSRGFSLDDLVGFRARMVQEMMDKYEHPSGIFSAADGWVESSVEVPLPKTKAKYKTEADAPKITIKGVFHRRLTAVVRGVAEDERFASIYNWNPHRTFWEPPQYTPRASTPHSSHESPSPQPPEKVRIYTDVFNADAAWDVHEKIRQRPRNPADAPGVQYAAFIILLGSDATHLTSFGAAQLWPIYLYFAALSKYIRSMPTQFSAQHLAYIPSLPDSIQDAYKAAYNTPASADVVTFCKRELMQQIWLLLLDDEFMDAYENGILVECGDGVVRRIFPRILTYSADYPEKILLASLKPLARCPCPRCLVEKDDIHEAGTGEPAPERVDDARLRRDILKARKLVFTQGISLAGKRVKGLLDSRSLNPIQSAFSVRLAQFGVNFYELFAPDLLHEFEIGVWKAVFLHLLRLIAAQGDDSLKEFNQRMQNMPTFGRDKIRKFWNDVAACKNLAARDYEDFLICMMPVMEGLLPLRDDETVADLLFELANWHALAKLRLHTDTTLDIFRSATTQVYEAIRAFATTTCQDHETRELEKEADARVRQEARKKPGAPTDRTRKIVKYNGMNTIKFHSMLHYPDYIARAGTTDNYSTQNCELEHRHVKRFYVRTNKIGYSLQIAKHQRRAALLRALRARDDYVPRRVRRQDGTARAPNTALPPPPPPAEHLHTHAHDAFPPTSPLDHYAISQADHTMVRLRHWLIEHQGDPSTKDFLPTLREHFLGRLLDDHVRGGDPNRLDIQGDRIYRHKVLRVNYTTYDMRRDQDTVNPRTHPDIMVLASDNDADSHPYWYARILSIFHAQVRYTGPGATARTRRWQRVEFLWVRWFELDPHFQAGFQERRQPRLRFVNAKRSTTPAFGFLDPTDVLRAAYLMPAFAYGTTGRLLGPSRLARRPAENDHDYEYYYVSMFVDRDMYMRFLGGGVGHHGVGISHSASRDHALRSRPPGPPEDEESARDAMDEDGHSTSDGDSDTAAGDRESADTEEDEDEGEDAEPEESGDEGSLVRPWDDEFDDEDSNSFWRDEEDEGDAAPAELDAAAVGADLAGEEDFYVDYVYAAEGYAPY